MCNVCRGDRGRMQGKNTHAYGIFYKHLFIYSTPEGFGDVWLTDTVFFIILSIKKSFGKASSGSLPENGSRAGFWNFMLFKKHLDNGQSPKKDTVSVID